MANIGGNLDRLRMRLNFTDSPTFASEPSPGLSPMTHLTLNLSDTNLSTTPRRKLSLPDNDNTPLTHRVKHLPGERTSDTIMDSPHLGHRLLKNVIKLPVGGASGGGGGGGGLVLTGRGRGFGRRISMSPLLAGSPLGSNNKENCSAGASGGPAASGPEDSGAAAIFLSPQKPSSPAKTAGSPAKFQLVSPLRMRQPLEDHDPNSQDSGYGPIFPDKDDAKAAFRFMEPVGTAPRRQLVEQSPCKDMLIGSPRSRSSGYGSPPFFHSLSSSSGSGTESSDDGFVELMLESDKMSEESQFPTGMGSLLSGTLKEHNTLRKDFSVPEIRPKPTIRRHLSLIETSSRVQRCPFRLPITNENEESKETVRIFKRPEPPVESTSLMQCLKRPKINPLCIIPENKEQQKTESQLVEASAAVDTIVRPKLQRSYSETEATIKKALQRSSQDPDLIGDFSKPFILPLMEGRHQDLKAISADTLAKLLNGEFCESIESFLIIDCRYPYEYDGGHIRGSRNIFTQDQIIKEFVEAKQSEGESIGKRNILIFHCEFSSERGPKLSRFLRNSDRFMNRESYPALHYPEVYLLHGGYKEFFEKHSDLCEPCSYLPMLHPNHEADLRHFRTKSKSGSSNDSKARLAMRSNLKRLGL